MASRGVGRHLTACYELACVQSCDREWDDARFTADDGADARRVDSEHSRGRTPRSALVDRRKSFRIHDSGHDLRTVGDLDANLSRGGGHSRPRRRLRHTGDSGAGQQPQRLPHDGSYMRRGRPQADGRMLPRHLRVFWPISQCRLWSRARLLLPNAIGSVCGNGST